LTTRAKSDILPHDAVGVPGCPNGLDHIVGVIIHQYHIGRLDGCLGAQAPHGHAHMGGGQGRGVVDPIPHEGDLAAAGLPDTLQLRRLFVGQKPGAHFMDTQFASYLFRHRGAVSGEHNHFHTQGLELRDRLSCPFLGGIHQGDGSPVAAIDSHVHT